MWVCLQGNSLRNAVIEHASISGLRSLRTDRLHVSAEVPGHAPTHPPTMLCEAA